MPRVDPGAYDVEAHKGIVSCSDLGKLFGLDTNCAPRLLLRSKVEGFQLPVNPSETTRFMLTFGKDMEPVAIAWYRRMFRLSVTLLSMMISPEEPRLGGTIDGIDELGRILEVKWRCYPNINDAEPFRAIPHKYYLQLQGYLNMYDREEGLLISCTIRKGVTMFTVKRDREIWAHCLKKVREFLGTWDTCKEMGSEAYEAFLNGFRLPPGRKGYNEQLVEAAQARSVSAPVHFDRPFVPAFSELVQRDGW
jgi:hypothetical protein